MANPSTQTVSRNVSDSSPIFIPAFANGILLILFGSYWLFNYVATPSTNTLAKSIPQNAPKVN